MTVQRWTGIETRALRQALRMSVRRFAEHLGVGIRTVSKWESRGENIVLLPDSQEILDVALSRAPEAVQDRFTDLIADIHTNGGAPPATARPGSMLLPVIVEGQAVLVPISADSALLSSLRLAESSAAPLPALLSRDGADISASAGSVDVELERRRALGALALGAAAAALPGVRRRVTDPDHPAPVTAAPRAGDGDVDAVRDMVALLSRMDQRRGGGHARSVVVEYFTTEVAGLLDGIFRDDGARRAMFSAAAELAYLSGWMAFDISEHDAARRDFRVALQLAEEAGDAPLAGHILRAMAHQAVDLGRPGLALELAEASVDGDRYTLAAPRERALLGVVHARALASAGRDAEAATALIRAEDDLAAAEPGNGEPARVFFFGEASLAHETACTLRDIGDLAGAEMQFDRSVRTRKASAFTRTHAVTLGYLGSVQLRRGEVDAACGTWSTALDAMNGVSSGRTRQVVLDMRTSLAPFRRDRLPSALELDARATEYLDTVA
jgi:tetratricopeptide (TPR) repeat protein